MDVEQLNEILRLHKQWLFGNAEGRRADLGGVNLSDANLGGANLSDANLGGANLSDANLGGANLSDANLGGANLGDANLGDANLGGANLSGANLSGANLRDADLRDADLRDADLRDADLGHANLRDADLGHANLRDADLRDADLSGANLRYADLGGAKNFMPQSIGLPAASRDFLQQVCKAALREGALKMDAWHTCETTHCLAGWAVHLAGPAGYALEAATSPSVAGALLTPDACHLFHADNETARSWCQGIVDGKSPEELAGAT